MFRKTEHHMVLVIGQEGENILAISVPHQVILPEFELVEDYDLSENPVLTLYTQVFDRLDALVSAGLQQFGTHESRLYGVIRSDERIIGNRGTNRRVIRVGLACYPRLLEPAFNNGEFDEYPSLPAWETIRIGLPTWDGPTGEEVPEAPAVVPEVIRPTRFERKWVI